MASYILTEKFAPEIGLQHDGKSGSYSARRFFQITPDDPQTASVEEVRLTAGLPVIRSPHPSNLYLLCTSVEVTRVSALLFEAVVSYSVPLGKDPGQSNPLLQPPEIEFDDASSEEPIDIDVKGKPICTVLGESFDPPIQREFGDLVLTVTRNMATFDPILARNYYYVTNSDNFLGFPPGTALMKKFRGSSVAGANNSVYWKRVIAIQFRRGAPFTTDEKAWYRRVRAEGFMVKLRDSGSDPSTWKTGRGADETGEPSVKPLLHDIKTGEYISDPNKAQWYYFQIYESKPFASLNIL